MIYPIAERFTSINGEGRKAGELAVLPEKTMGFCKLQRLFQKKSQL